MPKTKPFNVFAPLSKKDTATCAYLGTDGSCIVLFERSTPLGSQAYAKATTKLPNTKVVCYQRADEIRRVVIHRYSLGLLTVPLATRKRVIIGLWPDNGSENTREKGLTCRTLVVEVPGVGEFSTHDIGGAVSGGFTLQDLSYPYSDRIAKQTADTVREAFQSGYYGDTKIIACDDPLTAGKDR